MTDTTLKARLQRELHDAMRAKDKVRSGTLRMVLTSITNAEVAGDEARELSHDEVLKVVAKDKEHRDALTMRITSTPHVSRVTTLETIPTSKALPGVPVDVDVPDEE